MQIVDNTKMLMKIFRGTQKKSPALPFGGAGLVIGGGYLLSHFRSTIGVVRFNFSVRNGKRWIPNAIATLVSFSLASAGLSAGGASRSPQGG